MPVKFKNQIVWLLFAPQVRYGNDLWPPSRCPWGLMARNVVEIMNGMTGMSGMPTHDSRLSAGPANCVSHSIDQKSVQRRIHDTFHRLLCSVAVAVLGCHTVAMRLRQTRGQLRLQITNDQQDLATSHNPDQARPLMVIFKVLSALATTKTAAATIATMR